MTTNIKAGDYGVAAELPLFTVAPDTSPRGPDRYGNDVPGDITSVIGDRLRHHAGVLNNWLSDLTVSVTHGKTSMLAASKYPAYAHYRENTWS